MESLAQRYAERVEQLTADIARRTRRSRLFVATELALFALSLLCVAAFATWGSNVWLLLAAALFGGYLLVRRADVKNSRLTAHQEHLRSVYRKELSYLNGDFSCFPAGNQYVDPHHAFTLDMDVFGPQSLFNRINRTVTTGGSDFLASALGFLALPATRGRAAASPGEEQASTRLPAKAEIEARREAIGELASREQLRANFLALGQQGPIDAAKVLKTLQDVQQMHLSRLALRWPMLLLVSGSVAAFYVLVVLALLGTVSADLPMMWAMLQLSFIYAVFSRQLRAISKAIRTIHSQLATYVHLMAQMADAEFSSRELQAVVARLSVGQSDAVGAFRQLRDILKALDMRNGLWVFISNVFYGGDYFLVRRFLHWQDRYMLHLDEWISAVSHFDALVSMATFRYNEPDATEAEIVDADAVVYRAQGLYHPFLGRQAVHNDFSIADGHYYIVTGANMAGKSTFLRSVGINYILALCGMPVFAEQLTVSIFFLFSSMRTTDDLSRGISYFNAELLRLQQLIESCQRQHHTLIILDEILKGTNSLDKLNGSRLFLESIMSLPVTGIVATHDLELSRMQQTHPDRFHNYCFEIGLSDHITYTYKLTAGVARNQNATFLLRNILSDLLP